MKNLNYVPNPRYLFSLRDNGYNFDNALRELCDNSFDALIGVSNKKIIVHLNLEEDSMFICDNGCGMTLKTLQEALRLGSETGKNAENSLEFGHYGSGLKAACSSLGNKFTIVTKHKDDDYYTAIYDTELGITNNTWDFPVVRKSTTDEITKLMSYGGKETGTYLEITNLSGVKNKNSQSATAKTIKKIGEYYRYYLSTKKNDDKVEFYLLSGKKQKPIKVLPIDPMCVKLKGNQRLNSDTTNKYVVDVKGVEVVFYVDFYHISVAAKDVNGDKKGLNPIQPNITNQGIYVLRNGRQIMRAKTYGLFTKHNDFNYFRAELRYESVFDKYFGIDNKKINIDPLQAIKDKIAKDVSTFAVISKKLSQEATKVELIGMEDDDIKRIIEDDKQNPNFPKMEADEDVKTDKPDKPTDKPTDDDKKGGGGRPKGSKNQPYTITFVKAGSKEAFFNPIYKGGTKYELQINIDHKFYLERFIKLNKIGKKALVDLIYSVTLAQYNTLYDILGKISDFNGELDHEDKYTFIHKFMSSWSDYLDDKIYR